MRELGDRFEEEKSSSRTDLATEVMKAVTENRSKNGIRRHSQERRHGYRYCRW